MKWMKESSHGGDILHLPQNYLSEYGVRWPSSVHELINNIKYVGATFTAAPYQYIIYYN